MGAVRKLGPYSPKFHGAWIGSLGGLNIGAIIVGLIQTYVTHKALPLPLATLIESVVTPLFSAIGAYLAPLIGGKTTAAVLADEGVTAPVVVKPVASA